MNDKNVEPFIVYTFVYTKYTSWSCHTSKPHRNKFSKFVVCSFLLIIFSSLEFTSACLCCHFAIRKRFRLQKECDSFKHFRFAQFCSLSHKTTHTPYTLYIYSIHTSHSRSLSAHLRNKSSLLTEIQPVSHHIFIFSVAGGMRAACGRN